MTDAYDVLVVGGGMAGLSAAAWSVQDGRSVLLVEKGDLGGSAVNAGFVWTAPSLEVLREQIPEGDAALQATLADGFADAVDWVRSLGVEVQPAVSVLRFGRGHQVQLPNYLHQCERIVRDDERSDVVVGGETLHLAVEDGAVRGAEVRLPSGETRSVRAEATILATGGFANDPNLLATLVHPNARDLPVRGNHVSSGDGLRLAREAGGRFEAEDAGFYGHLFPTGITVVAHDDFLGISLFHSERAILLDVDAKRFVDETLGDHLTTLALLRRREPRGLLIADERVHREHVSTEYVEGVLPLDPIDMAFKRGARSAVAHELDELVYLPPEWGYDGEAVRDAVLLFNRQCAEDALDPPRRHDPRPLDTPPYYIIETEPAITFTFGGIRVDADARVLDERGRPIPGLFAAGADTGGLFRNAYAGGIAAALTFALRAARVAAGVRV